MKNNNLFSEEEKRRNVMKLKKILYGYLILTFIFNAILMVSEIISGTLNTIKLGVYSISILLLIFLIFGVVRKLDK